MNVKKRHTPTAKTSTPHASWLHIRNRLYKSYFNTFDWVVPRRTVEASVWTDVMRATWWEWNRAVGRLAPCGTTPNALTSLSRQQHLYNCISGGRGIRRSTDTSHRRKVLFQAQLFQLFQLYQLCQLHQISEPLMRDCERLINKLFVVCESVKRVE